MFKKHYKHVNYVRCLRSIFNTEQGREVLSKWMADYLMATRFDHENPHKNSFSEGERNFVLKVMADLQVDPLEMKKRIDEYIDQYKS